MALKNISAVLILFLLTSQKSNSLNLITFLALEVLFILRYVKVFGSVCSDMLISQGSADVLTVDDVTYGV